MTAAPIDTSPDIRISPEAAAGFAAWLRQRSYEPWALLVDSLATERDRLSTRLAEVERERDESATIWRAEIADMERQRDDAQYDLASAQFALAQVRDQPSIRLTAAEVRGNHNRVRWAEGLIEQLPENHDGASSWLMNYGIRERAKSLRARRGLPFNEDTQSAPTMPWSPTP